MEKDDIKKIFETKSVLEIEKSFKKSEIIDMYIKIFESKPLSANTKLDTIRDIDAYYSFIHRTASLHKRFNNS